MRRHLLLWLLPLWLFGAAKYPSPIPPPKLYFINLDPSPCDHYCLREHLRRGEIFSFLAKAADNPEAAAPYQEELARFAALFRLEVPRLRSAPGPIVTGEVVRIAVAGDRRRFAKAMERCARAMGVSLLRARRPFEIATVDIPASALPERIYELEGYDLVVAIVPYAEAETLHQIAAAPNLYIPTVHRDLVDAPAAFYYGGIDYAAQIDALLRLARDELAIFYLGGSLLSDRLTQHALQLRSDARLFEIKKGSRNLGYLIKGTPALRHSDILLNTPLVTSALILSQLTLYGYKPPKKLSTQINFNPRLFDLTQEHDREGLYVAVSTAAPPWELETAAAAARIDLFYDWLSYAAVAGAEALLLGEEKKTKEEFEEGQLKYDLQILRYEQGGFIPALLESSQEFLRDDSL